MDIKIIYEDSDILVVEKPPGLAAQSDKTGDEDLMALLDRDLLYVVQRLDRPVGGVMVYGKTQAAAAGLTRQITEKTMKKEYLAISCGSPEAQEGELTDWLKKLVTINMSKVVEPNTSGSKEARLLYQVLNSVASEEFGSLSLLKVKLYTGRHHQIRVQLSNAGLPLWGDNKYNKAFVKRKGWTQIALWSHNLSIRHPRDKKIMEFLSYPGKDQPWSSFQHILDQEMMP